MFTPHFRQGRIVSGQARAKALNAKIQMKLLGLKLFSGFFILVLLDQILKNAALAFLSQGALNSSDYFRLEIYKNYGIAFGIPVSARLFYAAIFSFLIFLFAGKVLDLRRLDGRQTAGMAFLLAGAAGNIIDRLRWGYIVDFVSVKGAFVFNFADILILTGAILLLEKILKINPHT